MRCVLTAAAAEDVVAKAVDTVFEANTSPPSAATVNLNWIVAESGVSGTGVTVAEALEMLATVVVKKVLLDVTVEPETVKASEFSSIPFAGHMSPLENPSMVNDLISGFMKRKIQS